VIGNSSASLNGLLTLFMMSITEPTCRRRRRTAEIKPAKEFVRQND
jgi:hypothetical protein